MSARAGRRRRDVADQPQAGALDEGVASSIAVRTAAARSSSTSSGGLIAASPSASASSERDSRTSRSASLMEGLVRGSIRDDHAVAQRLEIALQVGQRGPQLVRRVGDEVAPHPLLLLERRGHLVERIGQAGELLGAFARDAGRVVAIGDPAGRRADLVERAGEHPGEDDRQAQARATAMSEAVTTMVVTELSYMSRACSAESPASTIRAVKTSAPTTATPTARMTSPTAALAMAARAIRPARPRTITARSADGSRAGRAIADPTHGLDVARLVGVVIELVAQSTDVDVDRAIEDVDRLVAVHGVEQLVA